MNSPHYLLTPERLSVMSRIIAAALGGYVLVNLMNLALSIILPVPQYQGLLFAMMISFIFYTLAIVWVFAVRTATKAWLGLIVAAVPFALIDAAYVFWGNGV
jgi:hypothetical protein